MIMSSMPEITQEFTSSSDTSLCYDTDSHSTSSIDNLDLDLSAETDKSQLSVTYIVHHWSCP